MRRTSPISRSKSSSSPGTWSEFEEMIRRLRIVCIACGTISETGSGRRCPDYLAVMDSYHYDRETIPTKCHSYYALGLFDVSQRGIWKIQTHLLVYSNVWSSSIRLESHFPVKPTSIGCSNRFCSLRNKSP